MAGKRKQAAQVTPDELKARMRNERDAGNTRYGGDGERIVAEFLKDLGHAVEPVHAAGIDLSVDGLLSVDVKTHLALGKKATHRPPAVSTAVKQAGVHYPRVVFYDDCVRIFDCPCLGNKLSPVELTWEATGALLARSPQKARRPVADPLGVRAAQRAVCDALRSWIEAHWGLVARVVFRGNPIVQDSMSRQAWGPESFYQDPEKMASKIQLVVLLYFDGADARKVLAYALGQSAEIRWDKKAVGPNPAGRMTFNPHTLDPKFVYAGVDAFKNEFLRRSPSLT